ncbi:MAG: T9SS type A sorting domain-containing protein [Bacteroidota bacterium]
MKRYLLLATSFAITGISLFSQPTIDGDMSDAGYATIGSASSQNGFGNDNDMGVIKYATDNTTIYLGITGELTSNDNIVLFLNFSGYAGCTGALAGDGTCSTGAFHTSSTSGDYGLDGAVMDMDIDFAFAFNEGNQNGSNPNNFYVDAARFGTTGLLNCGYLGNTGSWNGTSVSLNTSGIFSGTGSITIAYHSGFAGNSDKGIEFSIPLAAFPGVTNTQTLQVFAIITNASGWKSNETAPGNAGASNLGNDANLTDINGQDFFTPPQALLPVELLGFSGAATESAVKLKWQTASETNNNFFEIQRSADARTWQTLGKVEGAGFSTTLRSYEFLDEKPLPLNFYRLRQVDFDESANFSKVISVQFEGNDRPFRLSPNPVENELTLAFKQEIEASQSALIFDQTGKMVLETALYAGKKCQLDVSQLSPGVYFLKINGKEWQERFVKN